MWWGQVKPWIDFYSSEIVLAVAIVSVIFLIAAVLFWLRLPRYESGIVN